MNTQTRTATLLASCLYTFGLSAQVDELEPVVFSPQRYSLGSADISASVTTLDTEDMYRFPTLSMASVLQDTPGVNIAGNGASGANTSVFIRGTESDHVLFVVDGIRMNDVNTLYQNRIGGVPVGNIGTVEIARGPHSVVYGSDAIGGVVSISSRKGSEGTGYTFSGLAGSNDTWAVAADGAAQYGKFAYSYGLSTFSTENERPNNDFEQHAGALRFDYDLTEIWDIGSTVRVYDQTYGSPNTRFFPDLDNEDSETGILATVFANGAFDDFNIRVIGGVQDLQFVSLDPTFDSRTDIDNRRWVLDLQADWSLGNHTFVNGVNLDESENFSSGFGAIDESQTYVGLFLEDIWEVTEAFTLIGGLRWDDFDTFGSETTWKVGAVYTAIEDRLVLRGNVGTGFRAPSFIDLYADSSFYVGNPDLDPEKSLGWDLGFSLYALERKLEFSATYFRNELEDLITFDFSVFPGTSINLDEARTEGVELVLAYASEGWGDLSANYTWLDARDESTDARLLRRPEHTLGLDYSIEVKDVQLELSSTWVLNREDIDGLTFARIDGEDYFTTDVVVSYDFNDHVTLRGSVTNLFDESYETAHGFPTLGRGYFGQVVISFD
ncbi:MAG: TonB-dependent receptor plug domain-containing protein [Opitutales bacterium]